MWRSPAVGLGLALLLAGHPAQARELANLDAFGDSDRAVGLPAVSAAVRARVDAGRVAHTEKRLGVPTFFWAPRPTGASSPRSLGLTPEQAARRHLADYAELYRLRSADLADAPLGHVHEVGEGAVIASFRKFVGGVPVFRDEIRVVMDRRLDLVAIAGYLSPHGGSESKAPIRLSAEQAIAIAYADLAGAHLDPGALRETGKALGGYRYFAAVVQSEGPARLVDAARVRRVLFGLPDRLEPAFHIEVEVEAGAESDTDLYAVVVSASDGRLLFRKDLTEYDQFAYRVFADGSSPFIPFDGPQGNDASPHPTGAPNGYQAPFVAPNLATLQNGPMRTNDPWLASAATQTAGNNADAYADLAYPDGFTAGDVRPQVTALRAFDRTYDTAQSPQASQAQIQASATQLFFNVNFLHDWFYDRGFDEKSGNAQQSNYGRGGLENDRMRAEAQDFSGRNNANMSVPADGSRPRMQMYVFGGVGERRVTVAAPANIAGNLPAGTATFGPTNFNTPGDLILVDDGASPGTDACSALVNSVRGKIALVDRGTCTFASKVAAAQSAGAIGVIIANNVSGSPPTLYGTDSTITIPAMSVSQGDGATLKGALSGGAVSVVLVRQTGVDRDGTLDNAIVAHEWGHYISNRLIGNSSGLTNNIGRGLGEGWGDFHSLLMIVKESDAQKPANANFSGVYPVATYTASGGANQGYYFGIRRVPYATDFARNALTFKHIANGVPLPSGVPTAFGSSGSMNAEVHNTGEVWATMLWECYAALLRATGRLTFAEAQDRMLGYLVASYKATPNAPTLLEARDALLAVALARDAQDMALFAQAFARRGAGMNAVAPDRWSSSNSPVVESYVTGNDLAFVRATLDDGVSACDGDGILDNGETGRLTITLRNTGTGALNQTTAAVTSTTSGVTISNGAKVAFAPSQPQGTTTGSAEVSLVGVAGATPVEFTIQFTDPALAVQGGITRVVALRTNYDVVANASTTDDVEGPTTAWTVSRDPALGSSSPFQIQQATATNRRWFGPNPPEPEDEHLVSPPLQVGAAGNFGFSFSHRFDFEVDPRQSTIYYDGGVLELSADNGATWTDVGALATPGYNGRLDNTPGSSNPLRGRLAFVSTSAGYPAMTTATVSLGTAYAGKTVRIRFRIGADDAAAATGWEIDDIAFSGITNRPFSAVVADRNSCTNRPPVADAGPDRTVDERTAVILDGGASRDPDGDPISFAWKQTNGPAVSVLGDATATPVFVAPEVTQDAVLSFSLEVSDGKVTSPPATVRITVREVNRAPVAFAGPDRVVLPGTRVTLEGTATDPDGDPITLAWTQVAGPPVAIDDPALAGPTFTAPPADAVLAFELVANDGSLASEPSAVQLTVRATNRPPWADAGPSRTVAPGERVTLSGAASFDPEGDPLAFAWTQTAGPMVAIDRVEGAEVGFVAPAVEADAVLTFSLVVHDGQVSSEPATVEVRVSSTAARAGCGCGAGGAAGATGPLAAWLLMALRGRMRGARRVGSWR